LLLEKKDKVSSKNEILTQEKKKATDKELVPIVIIQRKEGWTESTPQSKSSNQAQKRNTSKETNKTNNNHENNNKNSHVANTENENDNNMTKQNNYRVTRSYATVAKQGTNLSAKLKRGKSTYVAFSPRNQIRSKNNNALIIEIPNLHNSLNEIIAS